jgi:hypothetical protein
MRPHPMLSYLRLAGSGRVQRVGVRGGPVVQSDRQECLSSNLPRPLATGPPSRHRRFASRAEFSTSVSSPARTPRGTTLNPNPLWPVDWL